MENYERKVYVIPQNIGESGGISGTNGTLKYKNLIEAGVLFVILAIIWYLATLAFSITIKIIAFALICLPVPVIAIVGLGNRTLVESIIEKIVFRLKRRKMIFRIPRAK